MENQQIRNVERNIINICLSDRRDEKGLISELMAEMKVEYFTDPVSIKIFNWIEDFYTRNRPIAFTRLLSEVDIPDDFFDVGYTLDSELAGLFEKLKDEFIRRQVNAASSKLVELTGKQLTADEYRTKAVETIFEYTDNSYGSREIITFSEALRQVEDDLEQVSDGKPQGIKTGFFSLDKVYGSFKAGDLIVIGGQTSMGKTSLVLNMIFSAIASNHKVMMISLEMTAQDIAQRMLSSQKQIRGSIFHADKITDANLKKVKDSSKEMGHYPLYISDKRGMTVADIRAQAVRAKSRYGLDMLVVDYLQNIHHIKDDNKAGAVGHSVQSLRNLAGDLEIPVILLSQLNRNVDIRPSPHHLRDSGTIEEISDSIFLIYRPDYKLETKIQQTKEVQEAELILAKGRTRGIGFVPLYWYPKYQLFRDKKEVDAEERYEKSIS